MPRDKVKYKNFVDVNRQPFSCMQGLAGRAIRNVRAAVF